MSEYRRVHRITPLLLFWQVIIAIIAMLLFNLNEDKLWSLWLYLYGAGGFSLSGFLTVVGGFIAACLVVWGISELWWRAYGFRLDGEEISVKSGVFSTKVRSARLDRIQAVDVIENVISRVFGVAAVRVETAGGNDSVIKIAYLKKQQAHELRDEILRKRAPGTSISASDEYEIASVPRQGAVEIIPPIPIIRSLVASALTVGVVLVPALMFSFIPGGYAVVFPALIGLLPKTWDVIDRSWKFNAMLDGNLLQVSYGLADKRRQSIPVERIHGVRIRQSMLWRITGWWCVDVSIAGYSSKDKHAGTTRLLPVGTRDQVLALVSVISPLSGAEVDEFAAPEGFCKPNYLSPRRARWVSPIDFSRQAVTLLEHAVILHEGRFGRCVKIIHPSHIQELTRARGPVQRLFQLDSVRLDLVGGPVRMTAHDLDPADSEQLMYELRGRKLPLLR